MLGNMKELYLQELRSNGLGIGLTDESPASEIEDAYYSMKKFTDIDKIYAIISTYKDEDDEIHTEYKFSLDKDKAHDIKVSEAHRLEELKDFDEVSEIVNITITKMNHSTFKSLATVRQYEDLFGIILEMRLDSEKVT